jgi:hypothetical protein
MTARKEARNPYAWRDYRRESDVTRARKSASAKARKERERQAREQSAQHQSEATP